MTTVSFSLTVISLICDGGGIGSESAFNPEMWSSRASFAFLIACNLSYHMRNSQVNLEIQRICHHQRDIK